VVTVTAVLGATPLSSSPPQGGREHTECAAAASRSRNANAPESCMNLCSSKSEGAGNGFNGFLRALPGDRAFLPPSPRNATHCRELTSASRYQDHTTSPSTNGAFVSAPSASTASPLTFVTIAKRPSLRDGMIRFYCCFYQAVKNNFGKSEIAANFSRELEMASFYPGSAIVLDFGFVPMGKQGAGPFPSGFLVSGPFRFPAVVPFAILAAHERRSSPMDPFAVAFLLLPSIAIVMVSGDMARTRGRSAKAWAWIAAATGPLPIAPIALLLLGHRKEPA
jgi:hypothetical protein